MRIQNHWKYLLNKGIFTPGKIVCFLGVLILFLFVRQSNSDASGWLFLKFMLIYLLLLILVVLYVHFRYYYANKNVGIEENGIVKDNVKYQFQNIRVIYVYKPNGMAAFKFNPVSDYYFLKVIFENGEEIMLTSLLRDDIDQLILNKWELAQYPKIISKAGAFSNFPFW